MPCHTNWQKRLSFSSYNKTADVNLTDYEKVIQAVKDAVARDLAHQNMDGITALGVDGIADNKEHHYLTVVDQIDRFYTRLLWVVEERKVPTLEQFFD